MPSSTTTNLHKCRPQWLFLLTHLPRPCFLAGKSRRRPSSRRLLTSPPFLKWTRFPGRGALHPARHRQCLSPLQPPSLLTSRHPPMRTKETFQTVCQLQPSRPLPNRSSTPFTLSSVTAPTKAIDTSLTSGTLTTTTPLKSTTAVVILRTHRCESIALNSHWINSHVKPTVS